MSLEYIRRCYGVPAEIGRRVRIDGRPGVIAEELDAPYIGVLFDDQPPNVILPAHPAWKVEYLNMGGVRRMTRSQRRYRDYLKVRDCFHGFRDYLMYLTRRSQEGRV